MAYSFTELLSLSEFERHMDAFYVATSLPHLLADGEGRVLLQTPKSRICESLGDIIPGLSRKCEEAHSNMKNLNASSAYHEFICPLGLTEYIIPIDNERQRIANIILGRFYTKDTPIETLLSEIECPEDKIDEVGAILKDIPVISEEKAKAYVEYYSLTIRKLIDVRVDSIRSQKISEKLWLDERILSSDLKFLQILLETIPNPIFYTNSEGIYIGCNSAFEEYTGRSRGEIIGTMIYDIVPEDYADIFDTHGTNLVKKTGVQVYEERVKNAYNEERDVLFYTAIIKQEDGGFGGLVGVMLDISDRKRMEAKIRLDLDQRKKSILKAGIRQRHLNPETLPLSQGVSMCSLYMPSQVLGGDFFDVYKTPKGKIVILIGDCTGHGVESALDATLMKAIVDRHIWLLEKTDATDAFLEDVNRDMMRYTSEEEYPTLFVCLIDPKTGEVFYSNANGELPYLITQNGISRFPHVTGFHIGFDEATEYKKKSLSVRHGDTICFFSDAIIEVINEHGDLIFDEKRLAEEFKFFTDDIDENLTCLMKALENSVDSLPLKDDLTLVLARFNKSVEDRFIISTREELEETRRTVEEILRNLNYTQDDISEFSVSMHELGVNAITHGNKNDYSKKIIISIEADAQKVCASIEDEGNGFDRTLVPMPTDFKRLIRLIDNGEEKVFTHGRGVWLASHYLDDLSYNSKGNKASFVKEKRSVKTRFIYHD